MEKPQADRDRMKTLLAEAITTLCRNGLQYDEELTVEGLIGITLDKKEVFLVSVKESFVVPGKIKTDKSQAAESAEVSPRKARKRPSSSASDGASREKHRNTGDSDDDYSNDDEEQAGLLDQNSRSSMGSTDHGGGGNRSRKKKDDVILIDPDLTIKEEILTQEGKQPSSRHHQSRSSDPRTRHPAAVQQEEPGLIFAEEVKQEHDPDLAEVFETSQEVIHMPQSMSTMTSGQPVPVSMVPSSSGFSGANMTIGAGAPDLSGLPIDWGSPSTSQDFSQAMSPSHQAPGFSGASQQKMIPLVSDALGKYASVMVHAAKLNDIIHESSIKTYPSRYLLNKILELVFTKAELLRGVTAHYYLKVEAVKEFVAMKVLENKWKPLSQAKFKKTIQNKIDYVRRHSKDRRYYKDRKRQRLQNGSHNISCKQERDDWQ